MASSVCHNQFGSINELGSGSSGGGRIFPQAAVVLAGAGSVCCGKPAVRNVVFEKPGSSGYVWLVSPILVGLSHKLAYNLSLILVGGFKHFLFSII